MQISFGDTVAVIAAGKRLNIVLIRQICILGEIVDHCHFFVALRIGIFGREIVYSGNDGGVGRVTSCTG